MVNIHVSVIFGGMFCFSLFKAQCLQERRLLIRDLIFHLLSYFFSLIFFFKKKEKHGHKEKGNNNSNEHRKKLNEEQFD